MTDPAHPVQTDMLTELADALAARVAEPQHRSAGCSPPSTATRRPTRASSRSTTPRRTAATRCCSSTGPLARLGHESGFSQDGKTFYATGTAPQSITAIDVTDPKDPHADLAGQRRLARHVAQRRRQPRLHRRPQRARHADPRHQRDPGAQGRTRRSREISRLTWEPRVDPAERDPVHRGRPPLRARVRRVQRVDARPERRAPTTSARRASSTSPTRRSRTVVANLRLQVNQPADHAAAAGRPGRDQRRRRATPRTTATSRRAIDPKIVACSFIASGLRVFDISDLDAPEGDRLLRRARRRPSPRTAGRRATSRCRSRRSCPSGARSGSPTARAASTRCAWPRTCGRPRGGASGAEGTPARPRREVLSGRRRFAVHVRLPRGARVRSIRATLAGKRVRIVRRGRARYADVNMRGLKKSAARLTIRVHLLHGKTRKSSRVYRLCPT